MRIVWSGIPSAQVAGCRPTAQSAGVLRRSPLGLDAWMDATFRELAQRGRVARPPGEERVRLRAVVLEQPSGWLIACEVPGVPREGVDVQLEGRQLTVTARRSLEAPAGFVARASERRGTVGVVRFELSENADLEALTATLRDGVLEVRVGRREASPRRVIPVLASTNAPADRTPDVLDAAAETPVNQAAQAQEDV